jgi:hypothetical protein
VPFFVLRTEDLIANDRDDITAPVVQQVLASIGLQLPITTITTALQRLRGSDLGSDQTGFSKRECWYGTTYGKWLSSSKADNAYPQGIADALALFGYI